MSHLWQVTPLAALAALACTNTWADDSGAELRLHAQARQANPAGPASLASPARSDAVADLALRGAWRVQPRLTFAAEAWLQAAHAEGGATTHDARFNELQASADLGAWQASAGKKVVAWDVGQGFRPNDLVQQGMRRMLLETRPVGRPLLHVEHFGTDSAAALVWVNPQRLNTPAEVQRFGHESALAARGYLRAGAADWHVFARQGRHTGSSLGLAVAWVGSDALELHASARALQRHHGWHPDDAAGTAPLPASPWQVRTLGAATQALMGATWTGEHRQSLLAEWWHDGTAPSDGNWDRWQARNTALLAAATRPGTPPALATASAGNLAWQAAPLAAASLRRDNLFLRAAWQAEPWQIWADLLHMPADAGRVLTTGLQWQGDAVRVTAALRRYGGPAEAVSAQLPQRLAGVVAANWSW